MEPARRLALGQWFTPAPVADLALALALPGVRAGARVLDPACGDGVFLARAVAAGIAPGALAGVELDPATAAAARARLPGAAIAVGDFFASAPRGGFDAVVGNPPYVRKGRIAATTLAAMRAHLADAYPGAPVAELDRLVGRGDLAAGFVAAALAMLRPGGRAALVVSSALLDAGYAAPLWQLVGRAGRVAALIDAPAERWFADAAVNAVILVLERAPAGPPVTIARLRRPTAIAAERLASGGALADVAELREGVAARPDLWSALVRAPALWFEVARVAGAALRPLGELAEVRRGVTSGANEVFYLARARADALELEPAVLAPLLRSPRASGDTIAVDVDATPHVALVAPAAAAELARYPAARRYLDGVAAAAERPTLKARPSWWALPARPAQVFLAKAYHARFVQRFAARPVLADQRLYAVYPQGGRSAELIAAALNSTFTALALESLGRSSLGEGALEWTVADAVALPVLDPAALPPAARDALLSAFAALATRPIGTVFAERDAADRAALDGALARAAPGLIELLPAVHDALAAAVTARTGRAQAASP